MVTRHDYIEINKKLHFIVDQDEWRYVHNVTLQCFDLDNLDLSTLTMSTTICNIQFVQWHLTGGLPSMLTPLILS